MEITIHFKTYLGHDSEESLDWENLDCSIRQKNPFYVMASKS